MKQGIHSYWRSVFILQVFRGTDVWVFQKVRKGFGVFICMNWEQNYSPSSWNQTFCSDENLRLIHKQVGFSTVNYSIPHTVNVAAEVTVWYDKHK